jgi:hypothetical protein
MRPDLTPADHGFASVADAEQALIDQGFQLGPDRGIGAGGFGWISADGTIEAGIYGVGKESWDPECRIEYVPLAQPEAAEQPAPASARSTHIPFATALIIVLLPTMTLVAGAAVVARVVDARAASAASVIHFAPEWSR